MAGTLVRLSTVLSNHRPPMLAKMQEEIVIAHRATNVVLYNS